MQNLVEITKEKFGVILDIRYATNNNLTGKQIYPKPVCYLHRDAASLLKKSVELAAKQNYLIKIFDAFRPFKYQKFLFEKFKKYEGLFSNPDTGAVPHCRGIAIDLTLTNKDGKELEMRSDFDDTTELAYHDCDKISDQAKKNRKILKNIMTEAGWDFYDLEWWHYQLFNPREYSLIKEEVK